eukprot:TRINITY_DN9_c0_g1_i2.p1 TRINITY_DN9_c0_g1~~TRINITY_DN9_c0_g1_i2.p1  ORF type:complete len:216 (-),score=36.52 TRINITY_DN9_c0_g1_i2:64-711(-)
MSLVALLVVLCFTFASADVYGVDVSSSVSQSAWSCLKSQHGVQFAVARAFTSVGTFDHACVDTVKNARAAGLSPVDVYFFPAFHHIGANASVDTFHKGMVNGNVQADKVWLDIEGSDYWGSDHATNVRYIVDLYYRLVQHGYKVGVYTSNSQWSPITGNAKVLGNLPLWYAHYENTPQPNFNDWKPFGAWSSPSIKQYRGTHTECGVGIDSNWHP